MKLLLIEDDPLLAQHTQETLAASFCVDWATNRHDAETFLALNRYHCIIADYHLPDCNAQALCQSLRKAGNTVPFLIITGDREEKRKIQSLLEGADDYLFKPFYPQELLARIHALLRRAQFFTPNIVTVGNLTINQTARTAHINNRLVTLTRKEYDLLHYLVLHANTPLSATELLESLWDSNREPYSNTIEVHICRLRRKLRILEAAVTVKTIKTGGYQLLT